jgi:hypothetical protein
MTLAQIVEKPMTAAIDEAIKSLADSRHGRRPAPFPYRPFLATSLRRTNSIARSSVLVCARYVVAALNGDSEIRMR